MWGAGEEEGGGVGVGRRVWRRERIEIGTIGDNRRIRAERGGAGEKEREEERGGLAL